MTRSGDDKSVSALCSITSFDRPSNKGQSLLYELILKIMKWSIYRHGRQNTTDFIHINSLKEKLTSVSIIPNISSIRKLPCKPQEAKMLSYLLNDSEIQRLCDRLSFSSTFDHLNLADTLETLAVSFPE